MDLSSKKMGAAILILGIFGIILLSMNLIATMILRNDAKSSENMALNMPRSDIIISDLKIIENTPSVEKNKNPSLLEKEQQKEFLLTGAYLYESSGTASAHLDRQELNLDTLTPTSLRAWTSRPEVSLGICKKDRSLCNRSFVQRISGQAIPVSFLLREGEIYVSFPTKDKPVNVTGLYEAEAIPVIFN
jgi:hypothetical protein